VKRKYVMGFLLSLAIVLLAAGLCYADPLDDAGAKLGGFIQKAGNIVLGFGTGAGTLALGGIGIRRMVAKTAGDDEVMSRSNNHIMEVLKYMAIVGGAGLLASIGGSILK
jgi:hypothetical protein